MDLQHDAIWLIKSGGRIIGPLTRQEVLAQLRTKALVVLDEISYPGHRWRYIRDEPLFAKMVEELRLKNLRGEDFTTSGDTVTSHLTQTLTLSVTESTDLVNDDLTDEISPGSIVRDQITRENLNASRNFHNSVISSKYQTYGYQGEDFVKQKVQETARLLWGVTAFILIAVVGFVVYKQVYKTQKPVVQITADNSQEIFNLIDRGEYQSALEKMKSMNFNENTNQRLVAYYAALLVSLENQTVLARRLLDNVISQSGQNIKQALTVSGIVDIYDNAYESAKNNFNKALEIDYQYPAAIFNLGAVAYLQKNFKEAKFQWETAITKGYNNDLVYVLLADSYVQLWFQSKDRRHLITAIEKINGALGKSYDHRQELLIALSYLQKQLGTFNEPEFRFAQIIDQDPMQDDQLKKDVFTFSLPIWNVLSVWCEEVVGDAATTGQSTTVKALCNLKNGNVVQAKKLVDDAVVQSPNDPLVQAYYSYILGITGMESQAQVALEKSLKQSQKYFKLALSLQGRNCQRSGDEVCAQKVWQDLYSRDRASLVAIEGRVQYYIKTSNRPEAKKLLQQGLLISSSYQPFLKLKYDLQLDGLNN